MVKLSELVGESGNKEKAIAYLEAQIQGFPDSAGKAKLLIALAALADKKSDLVSIAYERAVQLSPVDRGLLFKAAFAEGESNFDLLSIRNYVDLLNVDFRNESAYNNLAVELNSFGLPGKMAEYYKMSIDNGGTLAISNLANVYKDAGLWDEAKDVLDKAKKVENHHENVAQSIFNLQCAHRSQYIGD